MRGGYADEIRANSSVVKKADPLSGRVTDQNGDACSNCTVELVGVDSTTLNETSYEAKLDRADDLLDDASSPFPDSWNPDLTITGDDGVASIGGEYVAVHRAEDWAIHGWIDTIDLSSPTINPAAEETIVLSVWDPAKEGGAFTVENTVDDSLPGATVNRNIVVERIDPLEGEVDSETYEPTHSFETGALTGKKEHQQVRLSLPAGVYRVYPEGSKNTAYTIVVGNKDDLRSQFATELENKAGELTRAAKNLRDRLESGKFVRKTATTNATGHYSADMPANVDRVAVSAYKVDGGVLPPLENPTPQDMRSWILNNDYNGSVYMSLEPRHYTIPEQNADVGVRKFSSPPFSLLDDWGSKWADYIDKLKNGTIPSVGGVFDDPKTDWAKEKLERAAESLMNVMTDDMVDRWEDQRGVDWDTFVDELENGERSEDELREDIRVMEQVITTQPSTVPTPEPPTIIVEPPDVEIPGPDVPNSPGSAIFRQVFGGDFTEDDVVATWHGFGGDVRPISDEYISVNKRTGRGDEVVVEYPIPEDSPGGTISVYVKGEGGGIGKGDGRFRSPKFDGELPDIRSIDVGTLRPGVGETVSLTPRLDTGGVTLEQVEVFDPNGSPVNATLEGGEAEFTPETTGAHFVRFTFNDSKGDGPYVETTRIAVGGEPQDWPESVQVVDGNLGVYALAGDAVEDASVKIDESGSALTITALVEPEQGTNEIHMYLEDAPTSTKQDLTLRVVQGSDIQSAASIGRHVGVFVHGRDVAPDAIIYRKGTGLNPSRAPISLDAETTAGKVVDDEDGGVVIHTYTGKNGATKLEVNNSPGTFESWAYRFRVWQTTADIPFTVVSPGAPIALVDDLVGSITKVIA